MKVEILFSELYIYGDLFNVKYLEKMLPDADFTYTSYQDEPAFAKEAFDLIYLGSIPDALLPRVLEKLQPVLPKLKQLLESGTKIFATGTAADLFGTSLLQTNHAGDVHEFAGLGLFPYHSEGSYDLRFNSWLMGSFKTPDGRDLPVIGNKSEFSVLYTEDTGHALFTLEHGLGLNHQAGLEGYHQGNFYATKMLGPFFIMNPHFSEYFLHDVLGQKDAALPLKEDLVAAFTARSKKLLENITNNFDETIIQRLE